MFTEGACIEQYAVELEVAVSVGGEGMVVVVMSLGSAVASVLQVKQRFWQEKGPCVVLGDAWQ